MTPSRTGPDGYEGPSPDALRGGPDPHRRGGPGGRMRRTRSPGPVGPSPQGHSLRLAPTISPARPRPPPVPSPVEAPVSIFLVMSSGHLVAVTREVPAAQESLVTVLDALVQGPTNSEALAGLETAVPAQTTVLSAISGPGGIATVNLGGTFAQLVGQPQIQAVAQIVFTVTALPGVAGVSFELGGHAVEVPVASGAQVPVATRAQFTRSPPFDRWGSPPLATSGTAPSGTATPGTQTRNAERTREPTRRRPPTMPPGGRLPRGARGRSTAASLRRRRGPESRRSP